MSQCASVRSFIHSRNTRVFDPLPATILPFVFRYRLTTKKPRSFVAQSSDSLSPFLVSRLIGNRISNYAPLLQTIAFESSELRISEERRTATLSVTNTIRAPRNTSSTQESRSSRSSNRNVIPKYFPLARFSTQ